jgi:hypothetical protein
LILYNYDSGDIILNKPKNEQGLKCLNDARDKERNDICERLFTALTSIVFHDHILFSFVYVFTPIKMEGEN